MGGSNSNISDYLRSQPTQLDLLAQAFASLPPGSAPAGAAPAWYSQGTTPFSYPHLTLPHQAQGQSQAAAQQQSTAQGLEQPAASSPTNLSQPPTNLNTDSAAVEAWAVAAAVAAAADTTRIHNLNDITSLPPSATSLHFPSTLPNPNNTHNNSSNNNTSGNTAQVQRIINSSNNSTSSNSPEVSNGLVPTASQGMPMGRMTTSTNQEGAGASAGANESTSMSTPMDISNSAGSARSARLHPGLSLGDLPSWNSAT